MGLALFLKMIGSGIGKVLGPIFSFLFTNRFGNLILALALGVSVGAWWTNSVHDKRAAKAKAAAEVQMQKAAKLAAEKTAQTLQADVNAAYALRAREAQWKLKEEELKNELAKKPPPRRITCPSAGAVVSCAIDGRLRDVVNKTLSGRVTTDAEQAAIDRSGRAALPLPREPAAAARPRSGGPTDSAGSSSDWLSPLQRLYERAGRPSPQARDVAGGK